MSRKTATFFQLLEYINKPLEKGKPPLLFNLQNNNDDLNAISKEFQANSNFRKQKGSTRNILYHEILSFSEGDKEYLTFDIIQDLCTKYIELRSPNCLVYGKAHNDSNNPHIHLLISSNEYRSKSQHSISKSRFKQIKKNLELYQQEKYPELKNSLPILSKEKGVSLEHRNITNAENYIGKREGTTNKENLAKQMKNLLEKGETRENFEGNLENLSLKFYQRSENTCGVIDLTTNKKYRFKTLGLDDIYQAKKLIWERIEKREEQFKIIKQDKFEKSVKELNFKEDIRSIVEEPKKQNRPLKKREIERSKNSKKIRRKKNRIRRRSQKLKNLFRENF